MIKVNFKPKKDIKQYLTDDFNITIYEELTQNDEWEGVFEPLEFFNIFYKNIQIINSNIDNPLFFLRYIKGLGYDSKKLYYLLSNHLELWNYQRIKGCEDEEIKTFFSCIDKELGKLSAILYPERVEWFENEGLKTLENFLTGGIDRKRYDFEKVKEIIDGFDDIYKKIKFLIEAKTEFLQNHTDFDFDKRFGEKCQIEINSLRELAKIDSEYNKSKLPKQPQPTKETPAKNESDAEHTEAIKKQFNFFTKDCPRKGKQILNDDDFDKLINWTIYYYENDFKIPEIKEPIKVVNTNMTYVILAFRYLFKELYPLNSYPESLFIFFTKAFKPYSGYKKTNFDKVKNNKFVKELMNINK